MQLLERAMERIHLDKDFWQVCGAINCVCTEYREALAEYAKEHHA